MCFSRKMPLPQDNWVLVMPLRRQMCCHGAENRAPCQTCGTPTAGHGQDTGDLRDSSASFASPVSLQQSYLHFWDAFSYPFPTGGVQGGGFHLSLAQLPQELSVLLPPLLSPHIGGEKWCSPGVVAFTFQLTLLSLQNAMPIDLFALPWS